MAAIVMFTRDRSLVLFVLNGHPRKTEVKILDTIRVFCYFIIVLVKKVPEVVKIHFYHA